jgi:hypothetical protein
MIRALMPVASALVICGLLSACISGPSRWAERSVELLHCGMQVDEVEDTLGYQVQVLSGRSVHGTHIIKRGSNALWLDFSEDGLQTVKIVWTSGLKVTDSTEPRQLCVEE